MKNTARKIIASAVLAILLIAAAPHARLLDGYYQITSLKVTRNGEVIRGANNAALYIHATDKRIKITGAFRGLPFDRDMLILRVDRDTMLLCEAQNRSNQYKFLVSGQYLTGRHALNYEDGSRQVVETIATIRKMRPEEVNQLRGIVRF